MGYPTISTTQCGTLGNPHVPSSRGMFYCISPVDTGGLVSFSPVFLVILEFLHRRKQRAEALILGWRDWRILEDIGGIEAWRNLEAWRSTSVIVAIGWNPVEIVHLWPHLCALHHQHQQLCSTSSSCSAAVPMRQKTIKGLGWIGVGFVQKQGSRAYHDVRHWNILIVSRSMK